MQKLEYSSSRNSKGARIVLNRPLEMMCSSISKTVEEDTIAEIYSLMITSARAVSAMQRRYEPS